MLSEKLNSDLDDGGLLPEGASSFQHPVLPH